MRDYTVYFISSMIYSDLCYNEVCYKGTVLYISILQVKDDTQGIILPSVDKYDQMLIRQRIVLDRISKV